MIDWVYSIARGARRFLKLLITRFSIHQGPQNAASLAYTTLLSVVPLMAVLLSIISAMSIGDRAGEMIQDFIFKNFVPAAGESIRQYLLEFTSKASQLSGIGSIFLFVVALMLMSSIDSALNTIWEVRKKRNLVSKFTVYWVILSLGPVAIVASILATSYLITLPLISEAASSGIGRQLFSLIPIGFSVAGFTLMYMLVPNRRVNFGHAIFGGLLAALLFEFAKYAFAAYFTKFNSYQAIYGALAAIPIFMIWIYLSWLIVLIGAEFTHCLEIFRRYKGSVLEGRNRLVETIDLLIRIALIREQGHSSDIRALSPGHVHVEALLAKLQSRGFVHETDDGDWVLAQCLSELRVYDVYKACNYRLPQVGEDGWPENEQLAVIFAQANAGIESSLLVPMNEIK